MTGRSPYLIDIARHVIARHGRNAASLMEHRAQQHREAGQQEDATFWDSVANAVRHLEVTRE